jgi:hypothetical protein
LRTATIVAFSRGVAEIWVVKPPRAMHAKGIESHGWISRKTAFRPKTRLFTVLSVGWFLISPTPVTLLLSHQIASASSLGVLCWMFILPHPVFIMLAAAFRWTEPVRTIQQKLPDPNYDLRQMRQDDVA